MKPPFYFFDSFFVIDLTLLFIDIYLFIEKIIYKSCKNYVNIIQYYFAYVNRYYVFIGFFSVVRKNWNSINKQYDTQKESHIAYLGN